MTQSLSLVLQKQLLIFEKAEQLTIIHNQERNV